MKHHKYHDVNFNSTGHDLKWEGWGDTGIVSVNNHIYHSVVGHIACYYLRIFMTIEHRHAHTLIRSEKKSYLLQSGTLL